MRTKEKKYSKKDFEKIKKGYIPQSMEEKWQIEYENDILLFKRSWTGDIFCEVSFRKENNKISINKINIKNTGGIENYIHHENISKFVLYLIEYFLLFKKLINDN